MPADAKPQARCVKRTQHMKPQESYIAMISSAILSTPEKRMTLCEINDYLMKHYECFRGEYQGWKNSVRHNLSFNKCFVKILRNPCRSWGKNNYWGVVVSLLQEYLREDGKFRRRRKRQVMSRERKHVPEQDTECVPGCEGSANYSGYYTNHLRQVLPAQQRGVVGEQSPLSRYKTAFSIESILGGTQAHQTYHPPQAYTTNGWIELKSSRVTGQDVVPNSRHYWSPRPLC